MLALLGLFACAKTYLHAQIAQGEGVIVQPMEVWVGGHKLWVRVSVVNQSSEPMLVNRDAIVARLPGGQMVGRAAGSMSLHETYVIPPSSSHPAYVEFEEAGFDWHNVPQVTIDFTSGLMRGNQPVPVQMAVGL